MKRTIMILTLIMLIAIAVFSVSASAVSVNDNDEYTGAAAYIGEGYTVSHSLMDTVQTNTPSAAVDDGEVEADGINTHVATIWISCISVVITAIILAFVVVLAKRNKSVKK